MYSVEENYHEFLGRRHKNRYDTYEEAIAEAELRASKCLEMDCTFIVNKVEAIVKADPLPLPTKTVIINEETKHLLENKSEDN